MQRRETEGVVIVCDFCGEDWDMIKPMIEGHRGSVICIDCLRRALEAHGEADEPYQCTMCIREELPAEMHCWRPGERADNANAEATICMECIEQAARAFHRDSDVDFTWERKAERLR